VSGALRLRRSGRPASSRGMLSRWCECVLCDGVGWNDDSHSPRSREISTKVGVEKRLEKHVVKGGSQRQNTFMGVENAVVCLSVVLSTPMNVIWRCEPPL